MNRDRFAGICKQFRGAVKVGWGRLTKNPLVETAGTREQREGRNQERYGSSKEEAARQLKAFLDGSRKRDLSNS